MRGLISILFAVSGLLAQTVHITGNYLDLLDNPIDSASVYYYQDMVVVDSTLTSSSGAFDLQFTIVSTNPSLPSAFRLSQNYPNPFNPSTRIDLSIQEPGSFSIYNIRGALVESLDLPSAGGYELSWGGRNLGAGLYIYVLRSGKQASSRKMILLDGGDGSGLATNQVSYASSNSLAKPASNDAIRFEKYNTSSLEIDFFTPQSDTTLGVLHGNVGPRQILTITDTIMYEGDTLQVDWNDYFYNDSETYFPLQFVEYMYLTDTTLYETEVVAIDVLDTSLVAVSNTFSMTWLPVNDPPILLWSPGDTSMLEDDTLTIDLTEVFDDEDSDLTFQVTSLQNAIWEISPEAMLIIVPEPNWSGTISEVIISALDSTFTVSTDPFTVEVTPVNDPPAFQMLLADTSIYLDETIALLLDCEDLEDSILTYSCNLIDSLWTIENDTIYITPPDTGLYEVEIYANDLVGASDTVSFSLNVLPWPEWKHITGTIRDIYSLEGLEGLTVQLLDSLGGVIQEVQTDDLGEYQIPEITLGSYSMNVLHPDTNSYFAKRGMILTVTSRDELADSVASGHHFIMIPRIVPVPNSNGETVTIDSSIFYHGRFNLLSGHPIPHYDDRTNVHEAYDRPMQVYLGNFTAYDSVRFMQNLAEGDSLFGKEGTITFGRQTPYENSLSWEEKLAFDVESNNYPDRLGWNIHSSNANETDDYTIGLWSWDVKWFVGGDVYIVGDRLPMMKERYARMTCWYGVNWDIRSSLMNGRAQEPTLLDRGIENTHYMYARRKAQGYETGHRTDYREY